MDLIENKVLIERLRKGDEKAYMFLLDKYHRRLYAYALTLINDHALAQDIVQNVFLKTWQFRKKLNPQYTIQSFLYKSVYNEFVNTYKKDKATMVLQMKYYEALQEEVEKLDEKTLNKTIELVAKEVEKLPRQCKKVFSLSKKEGLTNIEIAEYLNISVKAVEANITKAFSIIRKKLGGKIEIPVFILSLSYLVSIL